MPKINNHPEGENSPNLVTLAIGEDTYVDKFLAQWTSPQKHERDEISRPTDFNDLMPQAQASLSTDHYI
jgi:hypothetical protein